VIWRRKLPRLREDTPDGTRVELIGVARRLEDDAPFVPPMRGVPCVVAHIKYAIPPPNNTRGAPTKFERLHNRPFLVGGDDVDAIVDAAQLDLRFAWLTSMTMSERSVAVGARVRVIGTVMRDAGRPDIDVSFREAGLVIKIVGSKRRPVIVSLL
jgi:hypothetical protein